MKKLKIQLPFVVFALMVFGITGCNHSNAKNKEKTIEKPPVTGTRLENDAELTEQIAPGQNSAIQIELDIEKINQKQRTTVVMVTHSPSATTYRN